MAVAAEEAVEMTEQINLEELVQEIEQGNSDFVLTRQETVITPKEKKIGLAIHIALIPVFGIGLILLFLSLVSPDGFRTINENTTHIHSRAYVKKHNLIVDYKMKNGIVQKTKSAIIESHSYISRTHNKTDNGGFLVYYLINPNQRPFKLINDDWDDFQSVEKTMREFVKITKLEIK